MRKPLSFYVGRTVQAVGLLLVLHAWIASLAQNSSMNMLFSFTVTGMAIFMAGWMLQRLF